VAVKSVCVFSKVSCVCSNSAPLLSIDLKDDDDDDDDDDGGGDDNDDNDDDENDALPFTLHRSRQVEQTKIKIREQRVV
jgi:hypothetical protein